MRFASLAALAAVACPGLVLAQSREAPTLYVTGGVYSAGIQIRPQRNELPRLSQPQVGVVVMLPVGTKAIGLEVATSHVNGTWQWDGRRGPAADNNFASVRRIAVVGHAGRRWRGDRLSIYVGGGVSLEQQREHHRLRDLIGRANSQPVLSDVWTEERYSIAYFTPVLRIAMDANLRSPLSLRSAYTFAVRYADMPMVHAIDIGVGVRFGAGRR